jgi:hypothetical protein
MAQSGFAIFFMLVLLAATAAMAATLRQHWNSILSALRGAEPPARADPVFTVSVCRTAHVPRVARFLSLNYAVDLSPVTKVVRAWPFERLDPRAAQG